jgi:1-phosphofructokinase family hexose kinase
MTIACVTPNPAIDRTLIVPGWHVGAVQRPEQVIVAAGGKGLNVARVIRVLGGDPLCLGPVGGHSGRWLSDLAQQEGLRGVWTWTAGETRTCTIVLDSEAGTSTGLYETGDPVSRDDWARLSADVLRECVEVEFVCFSGSLPPGVPASDFGDLLRALSEAGRSVWVDTSGPALDTACQIAGIGLKVNDAEIERCCSVRSLHLRQRDCRRGVWRGHDYQTLGQAGALLSAAYGTWHAAPPVIQPVNATGSGDAFLGGWLLALAEQCAMPEALGRAVAAGAANALSSSGGRFQRATYEQILTEVVVRRFLTDQ